MISVDSWRLTGAGALSTRQELRAGIAPVALTLTNTNPAVGTLTSDTLTFTGSTGATRTTGFDPLTAGTTTIAITQPTGYTQPTNGNTDLTATVTD